MISPYLEKPVRSFEQALSDIECRCDAGDDGLPSDRCSDREFRGNRPGPDEGAERQSWEPGDTLVPRPVVAVAAAAPARSPT